MTAGLRFIRRSTLLLPLVGSASVLEFFGSFIGALYGLYVIRELNLGPAVLGLLVGSGGIGALLGALVTGRVTSRLGIGRTITTTLLLLPLLALLIPLAGGTKLMAALMLLFGQVVGDLIRAIYSINEVSLRQAATPHAWLGRVNASTQFLVGGIGTLGLLSGGLVGEVIGMRATLLAAVIGQFLAGVVVYFSPVRKLNETPVQAEI